MLTRATAVGVAGILLLTACTPSPSGPTLPPFSPSGSASPVEASPVGDPSESGQLSARSLPADYLGFTASTVDPSEGEFSPNGTWVHAQDAVLLATELLPLCGTATPRDMPVAGLSGTYLGPAGAPGHAVALEFGSAGEAGTWFETYGERLEECHAAPGEFTLASLKVSPSLIVDTRSYPEGAWGERAWVRGEFVTIMLLQGDFTAEQLTQEPPS